MNKLKSLWLWAMMGWIVVWAVQGLLMLGDKMEPRKTEYFDLKGLVLVVGFIGVSCALGYFAGREVESIEEEERREKENEWVAMDPRGLRAKWARLVWWVKIKTSPVGAAYVKLTDEMKKNPDYAHTWFCNIAMPILDGAKGKLTREESQEMASDLMQKLFGVVNAEKFDGGIGEHPREAGVYWARKSESEGWHRYLVVVTGHGNFLRAVGYYDASEDKIFACDRQSWEWGPKVHRPDVPPEKISKRY